MEHDPAQAASAAEWAGWALDDQQLASLATFADWLIDEAIPAGGLGPNEAERVWVRHVADSLTFATGWTTQPTEVLDVGTGVGLPGIPLAILWPDSRVMLLDRGGRRTRLLERVVRILDLPNVIVTRRDVDDVSGQFDGVVFRGSVPAKRTPEVARRLLAPGGTSVVGLSRRSEPPQSADQIINDAGALGLDASLASVPDYVLDGPAWLLVMRRQSP
ncbi:MAG: class I SAM-dependent methyltransferase [Acidimicrobiia bacterium]|nr:class I SAM-dependent methyltransferase [Acidimicrobiia bacterium]